MNEGRLASQRPRLLHTPPPCSPLSFPLCREGRLVAREWSDLSAKEAYCLACLPALHQEHVLALIPTGVPVTSALAQLAGGGFPVWGGGWLAGPGLAGSHECLLAGM